MLPSRLPISIMTLDIALLTAFVTSSATASYCRLRLQLYADGGASGKCRWPEAEASGRSLELREGVGSVVHAAQDIGERHAVRVVRAVGRFLLDLRGKA